MESPKYMVPIRPPRAAGPPECPPPAYRTASGTVTETDTWSDYSGSSGLGKRRASWVNLVESDENLNKHKVNCYPKVKQMSNASQQIPSRAPSQMAYVSDNYRLHMVNSSQPLPVKAAPGPAGTLPPSRAPSVVMTPAVVATHVAPAKKKRNRLQEWRKRCGGPCFNMCIFLVVLGTICAIIAAIILSQVLKPPKKDSQTKGWDESWQYLPAPMVVNGQKIFDPPIPECEGARWVQLDYVANNQKNRKCSDCYDFCLPDYGIERDVVRGEEFLNIVKRVCFYLFVPEWRTYAQANTIEQ
ncbi:hypothetical protein TELCIR_14622, partial [Teladorsagia circumcincta]